MHKVFKYTVFDLMRSKWTIIYFLFYLILTFSLLFFNNDISKSIISLMNIVLLLSPLMGILFGVTYYYNSRNFIIFLLSQPIPRTSIIKGQLSGLIFSLSLSIIAGIGIPFLYYGVFFSNNIFDFLILLLVGFFLSAIFTTLSYLCGVLNDNKIKGFGMAILLWLFLAIIYDGIFLILLIIFRDYPLEKFALILTFLNPIDLARILILLKLDISALMGYTGAIFKLFFNSSIGIIISMLALISWWMIFYWIILNVIKKKDF